MQNIKFQNFPVVYVVTLLSIEQQRNVHGARLCMLDWVSNLAVEKKLVAALSSNRLVTSLGSCRDSVEFGCKSKEGAE